MRNQKRRSRALLRHSPAASCFLILLAAATANSQEFRRWTDNTGLFSTVARLQSVSPEGVELVLQDGRTVEVPMRRLSQPDLVWLAGYQASRCGELAASGADNGHHPSGPAEASRRAEPASESQVHSGVSLPDPNVAGPPKAVIPAIDPGANPAEPLPVEAETASTADHSQTPVDLSASAGPPSSRNESLPPARTGPSPPLRLPADVPLVGRGVPDRGEPEPARLIRDVAPSVPIAEIVTDSSVSLDPSTPSTEAATTTAAGVPVCYPGAEPAELVEAVTGPEQQQSQAPPFSPTDRAPVAALPSSTPEPAGKNGAETAGGPSLLSTSLRKSLDQLIDQFQGTADEREKREILIRISQHPVPRNDPALIKALTGGLRATDKFIRESSLQMLILVSDRLEDEVLRQAILDESLAVRWMAYDIVAASPREELLPALVQRLQERDRNKILGVIRNYGASAEKLLLPLLSSADPQVRLDVAGLLGEIGTAESIESLRVMSTNERLPLAERLQAKASVERIAARR